MQPRAMKTSSMAARRSSRTHGLRSWCSQLTVHSTTQRVVPGPLPCSGSFRDQTAVRTGATLAQLLAVIAIIAVLMSILMPSLLSFRETARRAQCLNNIRNLGLAMQNHASHQGAYPPGIAYPADNQPSQGTNWQAIRWGDCYGTWQMPILQYLELGERWLAYRNFGNSEGTGAAGGMFYNHPANAEATKPVSTLICPSDTLLSPSVSKHSYAVNYGSTGVNHEFTFPGQPPYLSGLNYDAALWINTTTGSVRYREAPFAHGKPRSPDWITDGLGYTLMAAEIIRTVGDNRGLTWHGAMSQFTTYRRPNDSAPDRPYAGSNLGVVLPSPLCSDDRTDPPCDATNTNNPGPGTVSYSIYAARSRHPGAVAVVMCDGSARFFSNEINAVIWQLLGTARAGRTEPRVGRVASGGQKSSFYGIGVSASENEDEWVMDNSVTNPNLK